jgi:hypothetical protein
MQFHILPHVKFNIKNLTGIILLPVQLHFSKSHFIDIQLLNPKKIVDARNPLTKNCTLSLISLSITYKSQNTKVP